MDRLRVLGLESPVVAGKDQGGERLTMISEGRIACIFDGTTRAPAVRLYALAHALRILSRGPAYPRTRERAGQRRR